MRVSVADCSRAGIGYTHADDDDLPRRSLRIARGLGSVTLPRLGSRALLLVADCSRAGIGYTISHRRVNAGRVADCSRAGIEYTRRVVLIVFARLRIARGLGSDTLHDPQSDHRPPLRIARGLGSDTLGDLTCALRWWLRIARGLGSNTLCCDAAVADRAVADCSQAGIEYTRTCALRPPSCCCGLLAGWDRIH